jgi:hypothetical protein
VLKLENEENVQKIQRVIDSIVTQIDLISIKSQYEINRKEHNKDFLIESSSILLQMSRTLGELILIQNNLKNEDLKNQQLSLNTLINGRTN